MLAGVNGAGKTTTIGKLAKHFQAQGKSVLLAAGDTFRAAAREQLQVWGERNNVTVIAQEGGDSAAVIFDAIHAAQARGIDIVLADTAGRLPTQLHLMEEIEEGQARHRQGRTRARRTRCCWCSTPTPARTPSPRSRPSTMRCSVTGLVLTKLDGTAKGGVIAAIAKTRPIPVRFIGVGEELDDLRPFVAARICRGAVRMIIFQPGLQTLPRRPRGAEKRQLHRRTGEMVFLTGQSGAGKSTC